MTVSDSEAGKANGHGAPEGDRMTDEGGHAHNGAEVSAASKVEERSLLRSKPILDWTREDWHLWAAGLDKSQDEPVEATPVGVEPVEATPVADRVMEVSVETDEPAPEAGSATTEVAAQDLPVEVQGTPSRALPEHSPPARSLSSGLSTTRRWPAQPEVPTPTARVRARSALGLMMLAVVVGALVAGLVMLAVAAISLVLRRALGA